MCCLRPRGKGVSTSFEHTEGTSGVTEYILKRLSGERIKFVTEFEDYQVAGGGEGGGGGRFDADGSFIPRALSSGGLIEISMDELHVRALRH